eukprot:3033098-Rhodomonas_salina.1
MVEGASVTGERWCAGAGDAQRVEGAADGGEAAGHRPPPPPQAARLRPQQVPPAPHPASPSTLACTAP